MSLLFNHGRRHDLCDRNPIQLVPVEAAGSGVVLVGVPEGAVADRIVWTGDSNISLNRDRVGEILAVRMLIDEGIGSLVEPLTL